MYSPQGRGGSYGLVAGAARGKAGAIPTLDSPGDSGALIILSIHKGSFCGFLAGTLDLASFHHPADPCHTAEGWPWASPLARRQVWSVQPESKLHPKHVRQSAFIFELSGVTWSVFWWLDSEFHLAPGKRSYSLANVTAVDIQEALTIHQASWDTTPSP